ncbi:CHAT domain-containing protein [Flexibacter flexilis DSM 6793]|uniref:CHAT domain-containing protein n=2 Tax=Flexibacter flexilis TaxID=998 RepID=A0A1I1F969_9BACT|nr:CHAT domain-containing protein [Flexibacter flexilis DSM 6793]
MISWYFIAKFLVYSVLYCVCFSNFKISVLYILKHYLFVILYYCMIYKYTLFLCTFLLLLDIDTNAAKITLPDDDYFAKQYQKGLILFNDKKEDKALIVWENALYRADSLHIYRGVSLANIAKDIANIYWKRNNYVFSLKYLTQSYIYLEEIPEEYMLKAKVCKALGICYKYLNNHKESIKFHNKSLEFISNTKEDNADFYVKAYEKISEAYEYVIDYENAILYKEKQAQYIFKHQANETAKLSGVYKDLGALYIKINSHKEALFYYQKAVELMKKQSIDDPDLAQIYRSIGIIYYYLALYQKSIDYYLLSSSIAEKHNNNVDFLVGLYSNIGSSYDAIDAHEQAFFYKKKALDLCANSPEENVDNLILVYNNIANTYHFRGKYKLSLKYSMSALEVSQKYQDQESTAKIYFNIGQLYLSNKILDSAMFFFDKGLVHCSKNVYPLHIFDKNYFLLSKTEVYLIQNKVDKATEYFRKIEPSTYLNTHGSSVFNLRKSYLEALICEKNEKEEQAIKIISLCDSVALSMNKDFYDDADRLAYVSLVHDIHSAGVRLSYKRYTKLNDKNYLNKAFFFAERNKMQVLLQTISESKLREAAGLPDSLQRKEKSLIHELKSLQKDFFEAKNKDNIFIDSLKIYYLQKYKEYENWLAQTMVKYPKYFELSKGQQPIYLNDLQTKTQLNDVIISYVVSDSATYAFIISNNDSKLIKLPLADSLETKIRNIRQAIMVKSDEDFIPTSKKIYNEIWKPIQDILNENNNVNNIVIIPDGALLYLPFDALIKSKDKELIYLLNKYTIAYQYSATLWSEKRNPSTANSDASLAAFAPVFGQKLDQWHPTQTLRGGRNVQNLMDVEPLPATELEVKKLDSLFASNKLRNKIYLRTQASEVAVKSQNLFRYKYLHFATHGIISDKNPDFSGLLLLRDSLSDNDGKLYASEIYGLRLNADLVVLSACESGLGKLIQGEGLVGLSRSFLYAGASNLSVSLWRVADEPTRLLMTYFYEYIITQSKLNKPIRYAEALQQAKLKLIRTSPYNSPYHWSSFILIGL